MEHPQMASDGSSQVVVVFASDPTQDTVIWLAGEHDLSSVEELVHAIATAVEAGGSNLIFDLSRVEFMDSTTIDQILATCTKFGVEGRVARVRDPSPSARYMLELCDLTHLVES